MLRSMKGMLALVALQFVSLAWTEDVVTVTEYSCATGTTISSSCSSPSSASIKPIAGGIFLESDSTTSTSIGYTPSTTAPSSFSSTTSSPLSSVSTLLSLSTTTTSNLAAATVIVDQAGGGQFTAINVAISYAQTFARPTVLVRAGTYNEVVSVIGTSVITIIGDTSSPDDYTKNQVTIMSNTAGVVPVAIGTDSVKGVTWRNINFVSNAIGSAATVSLRGARNAFYGCKFISTGTGAVTSTLGTTLIANSYIEGTDKLFVGYLGLYVFNSTIAATASSATIVYSHGFSTPIQISQTVLDSCSIIQKPGTTNTYVYFAGPNGDGAQVVLKYTSMASCIAPSGTRAFVGTSGFFGEYNTTGPGSYSKATTVRADTLMTAAMLSNWTIDYVFAHSFTNFATADTAWADAGVLKSISSVNAVAVIPSSSTSLVSSSSSSYTSSSTWSSSLASLTVSLITVSSTSSTSISPNTESSGPASLTSSLTISASQTSIAIASSSSSSDILSSQSALTSAVNLSATTFASNLTSSLTSSSPTLSSSSVLASASCTLPSNVPATAYVVGPSSSCARFNTITAAVAALPVDSSTQYIYILAGTYTEQIGTFSRAGPTIFRGESTSPLSQSSNNVVWQFSGTVLSSAGGSETFALFRSTSYSAKKYAFYNINFVNIAPVSPNMISIAMDIKAQQVGFYSCGFVSGQGTFLANYGTFFLSGCYIEGSQDFVWGYGQIFISNSKIVSNTAGYAIAAQSWVPTYPSQFVFDQCAFVPKTTTIMKASTYLGRDYSTSARVAVTNSFLDAHIYPAGWLVKAATTNVTFVEVNNTGPGFVATSRISQVSISNSSMGYTLVQTFGDISWIDLSAIVPFAGFPDSVFAVASVSSSATASGASATATSTLSSLPASATLVVSKFPSASEYGTVEGAISALPNDGAEKVILIMPGVYNEQINVNRTGKVTLRGATNFTNDYSQNQVKIQFNYGVSTSAGQNELTPVINSKKTDGSGLALYNIDFVNTFVQTKNYAALAADFYGTNMAAYGCSFVGFQDTLLANKGTQLFSNCYIEGSVDFIWGFSQAYFHGCYIATNTPSTSIAAQSRANAATLGGYVFDSCLVTYTSTYGSSYGLSYLGRPYSNFSIAVYKNSYLDKNINAAGWSVWQPANPQTSNVLFGEFNNSGPGSWQATTARASFATNLTIAQVAAYELGTFLGSTSWIDMAAYNLAPSFSWTVDGISGNTNTTAPVTAGNATSIHPSSGTVPPVGAILVSVGGSIAKSFANLTSALASLPADSTSQVVFMYPGTYTEQVSVNRAGSVKVIGYQSGSVGKSYTLNEVTITYSRGLSVVAPVAAGHTNAETAIIATASTNIAFYNINFVNTANSDGAIASYVSLAASVYGDQIGFYGCSMIGWQDTLLTGNPSGYAYYESSYIEGAIDFIWGYSMSYFKGCTIGAKKAKSCITAHSRASTAATGGYVFDQCLFTAAPGVTDDLTDLVYIGRPYSQYAKVIVKYSYLDSIIQPAGWKAWSATDPRLDHVTFAEYQNSGPGNWENNTAARLSFGNATLLTSDTYSLSSVMASTSWIDMSYWDSIVTPQPAVVVPIVTTGNSTTPPLGACIVSKSPIFNVTTYSTVAGCINSLPSSSALQTIFIYPGTYNEQLTFNRSGATVFQGYTPSPGNYSANQVIITNKAGVDTQGDASNSDSATLYSRGKNLKLYNINLINTFGTTQDYASLGFAIGNNGNASFYGCKVIGNQDTFDVNAGASIFAYNSYIEGNIDFIWGAGSFYFLASTIAPNEGGISITADKRTTNTSIGGIVFDQCTVTPAPGSAVAAGSISLGRPWNANARVAYIKTYLDSCVSAAGWSVWSSSTPNTAGAFFGEYQNTGPGSVSTSRASFSHQMSDVEATSFQIANFFSSTSWIDFTALSIQPFSVIAPIPIVTITSTISPTGSIPVVTSTSYSTLVSTLSLSLFVTTKNVTEKVSTTLLITESDVYKYTTQVFTTTSYSTVVPAPKLTTITLNSVVSTTLTIPGSSVTSTELATSKITASATITPAPVTKYSTLLISDISTKTSTPKTVSQVSTILSTETSLFTATPKGKTTTLVNTLTVSTLVIAATPTLEIKSTTTSVSTTIVTISPKDVTQTSLFYTTIPAGPVVTTIAKDKVTSYISITSTVLKTSKTSTTLTCLPSAVKIKGRSVEMPEKILKRQLSSSAGSSISTSTTTVFYTLPQSTSIFIISMLTSSTKTNAASKSTQVDTITSYLVRSSVFPGQTFTSSIQSTKIVPKTTTLPVSTSTFTVDIQGTSIKTTTLKGATSITTLVIFSTVKTTTITVPALTLSALTTSTVFSTSTLVLPTPTVLSTTTSIKIFKSTTTLPVSTLTILKSATVNIKSTTTPATVTSYTYKTVKSTLKTTVLLPTQTVWVSKTSTESEKGTTVTRTSTVVETTTLKSTLVVWTTSTSTPKGLSTCA